MFSWIFELQPLTYFEILHPQYRNNFHTHSVGRAEDGPRGLVGKRKIFIEKLCKSESVFQNHAGLIPKERDGIAAIENFFPWIRNGVGGDAPFCFTHNVNARSNYMDILEPLSAKRFTHPTVGEFSHHNAT